MRVQYSYDVFSPALVSDEIIEDFEEDEAVNSMSFKKRKLGRRSKNWTEEETDRFYEAITIVGNDFHAIASAFSRRSLAEGMLDLTTVE